LNIAKAGEKGWRNNFYLKAFMMGLGLSFLVFIPFIIKDGGRFLFYGDFNVQQVTFYRIAHDAVVGGNTGWSHLTDLGANFVGSYSFYLLGSPFFWLTIPFPGEWLQYLMGPLLILKFACACLTGYIYLHRYVKNQNFALIGSLLYAFSGFSIYNIFFNHFHEAIVFFPLLLTALDEYMYNRRRGVFALAVGVCCIVNYYFFVGMVTFTAIYFIIRLISGSWKINFKDFLLLALEAVLGLGISCVLLVPSILTIVQNSRVDNPINGWNALIYNKNQRYLHIIECFFFPPDLPARPNFTPDSESKWSSLGAWLPLFGMTGVIGWLQLKRKHWLKRMLWVCFVMTLVPVLNSSFQLFNSSFYARWYYMLTMMMALATIMSLEEARVDWKRSIKWVSLITGVMLLAIGLMPKVTSDGDVESTSYGLEQYPTRFWTYGAISFICIAILIFLFRYCRSNPQRFAKAITTAVCIVSVLYSVYFIALGKTQSADPYEHIIPYALNGGDDVPLDDLDYVRSDFYESLDNSGMFWEIPTIQAFHSIVPGSIMDFYKYIGVQRDVGSRPETSHYALRGLTSTRWLFDDDDDDDYFAGVDYDEPEMPGWIYYGNANGFDIWENEFYIPMGFSYDSYITESEASTLSTEQREQIMLKTVIIPDNSEEKWNDILSHYNKEDAVYSEDAYESDCMDRKDYSCSSFEYTNTGFDASISTTKDRIVFFSVPYEDGWTATVNGEEAEISKVNVGFMAVRVPVGDEVRISFTYRTPGLTIGTVITIISVVLLAAYIFLAIYFKKKNPGKTKTAKKQLRIPGRLSSYAKANSISFKERTEGGFLRQKRDVLPMYAKLPEDKTENDDKHDL
jgi:hypothetical protein